ncbi:hypothetical protein MUK42_34070 [Musa troglodytarum]|uniref:Uncharacterized protein n=1 Tax=Musa troglodytarum TaxID=320322 RepID=A0A9E7G7P8_9LILI|nr:hypothetical protein MUK42_34070 [Musa troglodytarum]
MRTWREARRRKPDSLPGLRVASGGDNASSGAAGGASAEEPTTWPSMLRSICLFQVGSAVGPPTGSRVNAAVAHTSGCCVQARLSGRRSSRWRRCCATSSGPNEPDTESTSTEKKQRTGKDFVVPVAQLLLVELFLRYDSFEVESSTKSVVNGVWFDEDTDKGIKLTDLIKSPFPH